MVKSASGDDNENMTVSSRVSVVACRFFFAYDIMLKNF